MSKLHILSVMLTSDNNPLKWTDKDLSRITNRHSIVGYLLKTVKINTESHSVLNIYVIKPELVSENDKVINAQLLRNVFMQWLESLIEDPKSYMFRNPPLDKWLETKQNWIKKVTGKLASSYNKTYDDCLSSLYTTILHCYNKSDIYIGNLHYLVVAANNRLKVEYRYMLNRLSGEHPNAIHLDACPSDFNGGLENSVSSLHEIIGGAEDPYIRDDRNREMMEAIKADLREEFSEREIDQIVNAPGYLPNSLYRKLLKWRRTHKREDYL